MAPALSQLKGWLPRRLILEQTDEHSLRTHLRERGLKTVLEDGLAKVFEGVTSLSEIQQMGAHAGFQPANRESTKRRREKRQRPRNEGRQH